MILLVLRQESEKPGEFPGKWNRESETESLTQRPSDLQPGTDSQGWKTQSAWQEAKLGKQGHCPQGNLSSLDITSRPISALDPEKQQNPVGNTRTNLEDYRPPALSLNNQRRPCTERAHLEN